MQVRNFLFVLLAALCIQAQAQKQDDIVNYINTYKEIAIAEEQRTGVPAAIKLAQGIHETQAGNSELVRKSNNHFGIKCKSSWVGDRVYHDDDARGECFRSYSEPGQSYRDHSDFLKGSPRYAFLFQLDPTDYKAWATGLRTAGYATNYRYAQIIVKLIEDYNLEQYTLIAMGKLQPSDEVMAVGKGGANNSNTSSVVIQAIAPASGGRLIIQPNDIPEPEIMAPMPAYPTGEFSINNAKCVFAKKGTALLAIAEEHHISFARLLDFNDLFDGDVLKTDQLVFLQRKRKTGENEFHQVQPGETLYTICQAEGIRMESLLANNLLTENLRPAPGEKLYLQGIAPARPMLAEEKKALIKEAVAVTVVPSPSPARIAESTHTVQVKDTLYSISKKYGITLDQLKSWNKLDSLNLKVGQQLVVHTN